MDMEFTEQEPESYEWEVEGKPTMEIREEVIVPWDDSESEEQDPEPIFTTASSEEPEPPPFNPRAAVLLPGQTPHPNAAGASEFMRQYFKMTDADKK